MGASIEGIGSNRLTIIGVDALHGAEATVAPNHIEVGSIAAMTALCGGRVEIAGARDAPICA